MEEIQTLALVSRLINTQTLTNDTLLNQKFKKFLLRELLTPVLPYSIRMNKFLYLAFSCYILTNHQLHAVAMGDLSFVLGWTLMSLSIV